MGVWGCLRTLKGSNRWATAITITMTITIITTITTVSKVLIVIETNPHSHQC